MEVRQFHQWFLSISVFSYLFGLLIGYLLIAKLDFELYAFILAYGSKFFFESVCFVYVLCSHSKMAILFNLEEFEEQGKWIPVKLYFRDLGYPFSLFLTTLMGLLIYNTSNQILYMFALSLPNQTRSLSINGAYFNSISLCNFP